MIAPRMVPRIKHVRLLLFADVLLDSRALSSGRATRLHWFTHVSCTTHCAVTSLSRDLQSTSHHEVAHLLLSHGLNQRSDGGPSGKCTHPCWVHRRHTVNLLTEIQLALSRLPLPPSNPLRLLHPPRDFPAQRLRRRASQWQHCVSASALGTANCTLCELSTFALSTANATLCRISTSSLGTAKATFCKFPLSPLATVTAAHCGSPTATSFLMSTRHPPLLPV